VAKDLRNGHLVVGCNQASNSTSGGTPASNNSSAGDSKNKEAHVNAPGVNVDVNKNKTGDGTEAGVDVNVEKH